MLADGDSTSGFSLRGIVSVLLTCVVVADACSSDPDLAPEESFDDEATTITSDQETSDVEDELGPVEEFAGSIDLVIDDLGCELTGHECLLPFPSDALTAVDPSTATGRRVALPAEAIPSNADGISVDVSRQNRADGFSPGSAGLVLIPGLDVSGSALPPISDIARSLDADSGSVILDATTGERWPHWAELDANASDPDRRGLFLRPAANYPNGHRIVIGLRDLIDDAGNEIVPTDVFLTYRDRLETNIAEVEARRSAMERVFADLEAVGVNRGDLVLAWEFTVISTESLTGPLVHMRDDSFEILGDAAPTFTVNAVSRDDGDSYTIIEGTYDVPLYLTGDGGPGNGLNLATGLDLPKVNGTWVPAYRCMIHDNTTAAEPGAGVIYGHGLLGSRNQVTSAGPRLLAEHHNHVICGTDLIGMAVEDVGNAISVLGDMSGFSTLADRLLQGHLNTLFLGRLMALTDGFASHAAFRDSNGAPLFDTKQLAYYGISQGGIMGPVPTAVSTDWNIGVFGVPGINYSTLLNRSVDFDQYRLFLDPAYPDKLDQAKLLLLIQMLWDRGEGNGYVNYFPNPLEGLDEKLALLHGALGDHQVANVAMDVMARSMEAAVVWPAIAEGRSTDVEPFWGIERVNAYPNAGSTVVMWDSGQPLPPVENLPPREGIDPHEDPRRHLDAVAQIDAFLRTGTAIDVCDGDPCLSPTRG